MKSTKPMAEKTNNACVLAEKDKKIDKLVSLIKSLCRKCNYSDTNSENSDWFKGHWSIV